MLEWYTAAAKCQPPPTRITIAQMRSYQVVLYRWVPLSSTASWSMRTPYPSSTPSHWRMMFSGWCHDCRDTGWGRVPKKNVTKTDIYWGSYHIHICVLLTHLRLFVPRLEILFFIKNCFLVCIFRYCTSLRIHSVLEIQGYYFHSNNIQRNIKKIISNTIIIG